MKRFVTSPTKIGMLVDNGQWRIASQCSLSQIKREELKNSGFSNGELFMGIGIVSALLDVVG